MLLIPPVITDAAKFRAPTGGKFHVLSAGTT